VYYRGFIGVPSRRRGEGKDSISVGGVSNIQREEERGGGKGGKLAIMEEKK